MKKTALVSVYDKSGIVDFCKKLIDLDYRIISTGGTYRLLKDEMEVMEVNELTGFKEILDGRVKTLHPFIHGGILYRRDEKEHLSVVEELGISSIDIVVNNLYPFESVLLDNTKTHEDLIENIDIGGPSMIRAAAKNHQDVLVVTDAEDYDKVIKYLEDGSSDFGFREELAAKAFRYTAYYDAMISEYFNSKLKIAYPERLTLTYRLAENLRYGENPHQSAAFYEKVFVPLRSRLEQLHGKELSYNNYTDIYNSVRMVREFEEPCVIGVKHNCPAGIGAADTIDEAFDKAYECDPVSIFGGVFAINRKVTGHIAEVINSFFVEIVIAPDFEAEAFEILSQKKNIRLIRIENFNEFSLPEFVTKEVLGGLLYQEYDSKIFEGDVEVVSKRKPDEEELKNLLFAFKACKCVASNGAVIVKNNATIGIGQGEVRRSWAVEEALFRAKDKLEGAVMASDGFFFEDTVELLKENNIKAVIQPGGSIKDENVIKLCDEYGIALVMTNIRHFRH